MAAYPRYLPTDEAVILVVRGVTLAMGSIAALTLADDTRVTYAVLALAATALVVSLLERVMSRTAVLIVVEAAAIALVVGFGPPGSFALIPYSAAPSLAAGLRLGIAWVLGVNALSATILGVSYGQGRIEDPPSLVQWALLSLGIGLLGSWLYRSRVAQERRDAGGLAYREASRLLGELRPLTRSLPGGLDPLPLGATLLDELAQAVPIRQGAVVLELDLDRRVIAVRGDTGPEDWLAQAKLAVAALDEDGRSVASLNGDGPLLVVPIEVDDRRVAVAMLEPGAETTEEQRLGVERVARAWGLRLYAAGLFEEVRIDSMQQERSRLAREIHDGVAQDVASLGYLADDLMATASDQASLSQLREEISRVVGELRLSIHDLRSEGVTSGPLTAAIGEVARRHGRAVGMNVHLRLGEGSPSMSPLAETEMFRIAQEAIINTRRHAHAKNLWVSCVSGPGGTTVSVEDDGVGLGPGRPDSVGMTIMAERAARIGARLSVSDRLEGGTVVYVELPSSPPRLEVTQPVGQRSHR